MKSNLNPKIYVACLASYNAGILHGCWINATLDVDGIDKEIQNMLEQSPIAGAEEYAIHDSNDFFGITINEYDDLKRIHDIATFLEQYGKVGALLINEGFGVESATSVIENKYVGCYANEMDFAHELFSELYGDSTPGYIMAYIDYEQYCKDIFIDSFFSLEDDQGVHVFHWN